MSQFDDQTQQEVTAEERELLGALQCGIEAQQFLSSQFGRDLVKRVMLDRTEALEKLVSADPEDSRLIRQLQNDVRVPLEALGYLREVIAFGQYAEQTLQAKE